jgi:hypothetical protein
MTSEAFPRHYVSRLVPSGLLIICLVVGTSVGESVVSASPSLEQNSSFK